MDPIPIPEWVKDAPDVEGVREFHLPAGSGISGPPAGAFLTNVQAGNSLRPHPMWHVLFEVTDDDLKLLSESRILVLACSIVPVFQVYPWHRNVDGDVLRDPEDTT